MRATGSRVLRREQRRAWRGHKRGRRATHQVVTTYGRGQQRAGWNASFSLMCAAMRKDEGAA